MGWLWPSLSLSTLGVEFAFYGTFITILATILISYNQYCIIPAVFVSRRNGPRKNGCHRGHIVRFKQFTKIDRWWWSESLGSHHERRTHEDDLKTVDKTIVPIKSESRTAPKFSLISA